MREVVFVDFARTAFANRGGGLRSFAGTELAAKCVRALCDRSGILEKAGPMGVESVFAGSAFRDKVATNPVRYLTIAAGLPVEVEGHQVEMQCGSAITSINHAAFQIALGYVDVAIAGGMESHSTRPAFMSTTDAPYRGAPPSWLRMHLSPVAEQDISMLEVSDGMAQRWGITRQECDGFALRSQQRLQAGYASGLIGGEIIPVTVPGSRKQPDVVVERDEFPDPIPQWKDLRH